MIVEEGLLELLVVVAWPPPRHHHHQAVRPLGSNRGQIIVGLLTLTAPCDCIFFCAKQVELLPIPLIPRGAQPVVVVDG